MAPPAAPGLTPACPGHRGRSGRLHSGGLPLTHLTVNTGPSGPFNFSAPPTSLTPGQLLHRGRFSSEQHDDAVPANVSCSPPPGAPTPGRWPLLTTGSCIALPRPTPASGSAALWSPPPWPASKATAGASASGLRLAAPWPYLQVIPVILWPRTWAPGLPRLSWANWVGVTGTMAGPSACGSDPVRQMTFNGTSKTATFKYPGQVSLGKRTPALQLLPQLGNGPRPAPAPETLCRCRELTSPRP
jgi:hypothetical protein